nr:odorant binding protein 22 [Pachyrhinus yasumatsui]
MKTVLIFCAIAAVALANPVQHRWNRVHHQCQNDRSLYVKDEIFEQLKRGEHPQLPANFGAHANCMLVKLDLMDSQGHVQQFGVKQAVENNISNPSKVIQIVNECSADQDTKEETALQLFGCFRKHNINIGQL